MFAGAVILVGSSDEILYSRAFGYAHLYNEDLSEVENPIIMTEDHLFDLASLTKVLGNNIWFNGSPFTRRNPYR